MHIKNILQKSLVVLCGFFAVVLFLEAGLRITGFVSLQKTMSDRRSKAELGSGTDVVLCLGDSFTFGLGAPADMSYPAQLERMGKEQGFNLAVINRGQAAANTSMILNPLEDILSEVSPNIVVLLAGGANTWNTYDMPSTGFSWGRKIGVFVSRLRVVRLLRLLGINLSDVCWKKSPSAGLLDEDMAFPVFGIGERPEQEFFESQSDTQDGEGGETGAEEDITERQRLLEHGNECFSARKYDEAIDWFEQLKAISPEENVAYFLIYKTYMEQDKVDKALDFLKQSLLEQPHLMQLRRDAVFLLVPRDRIQEAIDIVLDGLRQKPISRQAVNVLLDFFLIANCEKKSEAGMELISRIKDEALFTPAMLSEFAAIAKKGGAVWINDWVYADIEDIIRICRSYGAKVLIQNYPENVAMTDLFVQAAVAQGAQFLNQRRSFLRIPEDERHLYFASDGHCNERGYERMAVNILNKLSSLGWLKEQKLNNAPE